MTRSTHPIDRIAEAGTFSEALSRLLDALRHERDLDPDPDGFWDEEIARVGDASRMYAVAEAAVTEFRTRRMALLAAEYRAADWNELANALESGDYGRLAF